MSCFKWELWEARKVSTEPAEKENIYLLLWSMWRQNERTGGTREKKRQEGKESKESKELRKVPQQKIH